VLLRRRKERERHVIPFVDGVLMILPFLWRRKERRGRIIPFVARKCAAVGVGKDGAAFFVLKKYCIFAKKGLGIRLRAAQTTPHPGFGRGVVF
jgi:hypothetical protein